MDEPSAQDSAKGRAPDRLLAIAVYAGTVAAYRYLVLSEKSTSAIDRHRFAGLADEEQGRKQRLQRVLSDQSPGADCVLTAEDKSLVVSGPRLLDIHVGVSFVDVMEMMLETARKTATFYAAYGPLISDGTLRALFHRLAEESADSLQRLQTLAAEAGAAAARRSDAHP
jgi:hypothetical protein